MHKFCACYLNIGWILKCWKCTVFGAKLSAPINAGEKVNHHFVKEDLPLVLNKKEPLSDSWRDINKIPKCKFTTINIQFNVLFQLLINSCLCSINDWYLALFLLMINLMSPCFVFNNYFFHLIINISCN